MSHLPPNPNRPRSITVHPVFLFLSVLRTPTNLSHYLVPRSPPTPSGGSRALPPLFRPSHFTSKFTESPSNLTFYDLFHSTLPSPLTNLYDLSKFLPTSITITVLRPNRCPHPPTLSNRHSTTFKDLLIGTPIPLTLSFVPSSSPLLVTDRSTF